MSHFKSGLLIFITVSTCLLLNSSCENDFVVVDKWQNIPIVYGMLNAGDTAQYIRVEKAFLDENTSALTIAQIPDSLYFENATVTLREAGTSGSTIQMTQVDANLEGYIKDEGVFAHIPNLIYKTLESIDPSATYEIIIETDENSPSIRANTNVIGDFDVFTPQSGSIIDFKVGEKTRFVWVVDPNASYFELTLIFRYSEHPFGQPGQSISKELEWKIADRVIPDASSHRFELEGERFYTFIAANIDTDASLCRVAGSMTLHIDAGGDELLNYVTVFEANQSGITGSEPLPEYSNLSRGIGVFSTRYRKTLNSILIASSTREQLSVNEITGHLGFTSISSPCQ